MFFQVDQYGRILKNPDTNGYRNKSGMTIITTVSGDTGVLLLRPSPAMLPDKLCKSERLHAADHEVPTRTKLN